MAVAFPAVRPTRVDYRLPTYPVNSPNFRSVIDYPRRRGNVGSDSGMSLLYENILDAEAVAILKCYMDSMSGFLPISLPSAVASGYTLQLIVNRLTLPAPLQWRFAERPRQESIIIGVSTVTVELEATLNRENV
jgi:hypothetical protein